MVGYFNLSHTVFVSADNRQAYDRNVGRRMVVARSNKFTDDDDMKREMRNMFMRSNILSRRYSKCSLSVNCF